MVGIFQSSIRICATSRQEYYFVNCVSCRKDKLTDLALAAVVLIRAANYSSVTASSQTNRYKRQLTTKATTYFGSVFTKRQYVKASAITMPIKMQSRYPLCRISEHPAWKGWKIFLLTWYKMAWYSFPGHCWPPLSLKSRWALIAEEYIRPL